MSSSLAASRRGKGDDEAAFLKPADRHSRRDRSKGQRQRRRQQQEQQEPGENEEAPAAGYRPVFVRTGRQHEEARRERMAARAEQRRLLQTTGGFDRFLAELRRRWGKRAFELPPLRACGGGGSSCWNGGKAARRRPLTPVELVRLARVEWAALDSGAKTVSVCVWYMLCTCVVALFCFAFVSDSSIDTNQP